MTKKFEKTLRDIDQRCREHGIPDTIIGGMAAIVHGSDRISGDIDITILAEIDNLERILEVFADGYISMKADPLAFFQRCLFVETLIPLNRQKLNLRYLRARAKEFIAVKRSDVPERLEELLAAQKPRRKK